MTSCLPTHAVRGWTVLLLSLAALTQACGKMRGAPVATEGTRATTKSASNAAVELQPVLDEKETRALALKGLDVPREAPLAREADGKALVWVDPTMKTVWLAGSDSLSHLAALRVCQQARLYGMSFGLPESEDLTLAVEDGLLERSKTNPLASALENVNDPQVWGAATQTGAFLDTEAELLPLERANGGFNAFAPRMVSAADARGFLCEGRLPLPRWRGLALITRRLTFLGGLRACGELGGRMAQNRDLAPVAADVDDAARNPAFGAVLARLSRVWVASQDARIKNAALAVRLATPRDTTSAATAPTLCRL